jgi:hypothetical protein
LSPTDILTKVQRLSRQWKGAIDSSPAIKNKLWMTSLHATAIQPTLITNKHTFPASTYWGALGLPVYPQHVVTFNPVLAKGPAGPLEMVLDDKLYLSWLRDTNGDQAHPKMVDFSYRRVSGKSDRSALGLRCSWRDMFLTSPPITTALIRTMNHNDPEGEHGPDYIKVVVRDHEGLTLGLVFDTVMAALPSKDRERLKTTEFLFIGALYIAFL